jgi:hypothetical protein
MDRQCQKEHSNHTLVTVQERMDFVRVSPQKPDVLLLSVAASKADHF